MKTLLVTGASGNIGSFVCQYFCKKKYIVIGLDIASETDELKKIKNFYFYKCDLTKSNLVEKTIKTISSKHGVIDVLINNLGLIYDS